MNKFFTKRIFAWVLGLSLLGASVFAIQVGATPPRGPMQGDLVSAWNGVSITDALATHAVARAVWIGTTQSYDFSFDGSTWVLFQGATAGATLPFQVVGARITSGSASPAAGDIVFLY